MPILGGREQTPIPIHEKILQPDGKPSKEFVRYLLDAKQEGSEGTGGKVPIGTIIMYYGTVIAIPTGWAICDGQNDTPNLVDQFVLGTATEAEIGNTGGYAAPQMPAHVHTQTSHTHTIAHTHTQTSHTHTMTHVHSIAHDHIAFTSAGESGHTHAYNNYPVHDGYWSMPDDVTGWSHNSPTPIAQITGGSTGHTHSIDVPAYAGNTGATLTPSTGGATAASTGASSAPSSGGATAANTGSTGAGDEVRGNYPPYAILMFLMRTR